MTSASWQSVAMPESPEEIHARIVAAAGPGGRLPMPPVAEWDDLPWEVVDGQLVAKSIGEPLAAEAPRKGAGGESCPTCAGDEEQVRVWESWNFHLARPARPSGLPLVLWLQSNEHMDFTEMGDDQAAELGKLTVWLTRIIERMPHIGRVHVNRWGDGEEHLRVWFVARPERLPHVCGTLAVEWDEMIPPTSEDVWLQDVATVVSKLAFHEGRSLL